MVDSFMMAGFECTYARVSPTSRLDMLEATQHDVRCREDYLMLKDIGITTVREGLSWSQIDLGGSRYGFDRFEEMMAIGREEGIQQIWDLNHFDYPDYLDPSSGEFVEAFGRYARKAAQVMQKYIRGTLWIVPINEMSFFSWIAADQGKWAPFKTGSDQGLAFKKQLVRATIAAINAIWQETDNVRWVITDPFMRRAAREPASEKAKKHVEKFNRVIRFEAWDMLSGLTYPELGGQPRYLDIIGVNYYLHNQEWVISYPGSLGHEMMSWDSPDRIPLAQMLDSLYQRYHRPLMISETGSFGQYRVQWWQRTLAQVDESMEKGLPIEGVCIYPVLDRPEVTGYLYAESGLWDFDQSINTCDRMPHAKSLELVRAYTARKNQIYRTQHPVYSST